MQTWVKDIVDKWRSEGVMLNPPASAEEIDHTEKIIGFKFPDDFKDFYLVANGFMNRDMLADSMISLWPLERIISEDWGEPDFVGICDWFLSAFAIGFHRHKTGFFNLPGNFENASCLNITFRQLMTAIDIDDPMIY